ncbi:MAG: zinc carboxypeptidase [Saprospiraceae bacterium]|nr:zinc carboxypeptidase [Saprospiraceae bacterium]
MKLLAQESDRVEYAEIGRTHENRPLINLYISTPENLKRKGEIQRAHQELTEADKANKVDLSGLPVVLYQGYSIHGNEPSGVNASMLVAYYLAAGQSGEVTATLSNCFILLDPCYNPDGVTRFATWANSHRGKNLITDPMTREYNEMWPGGRTNHYWFDLNRDWLLLTHPESKARVKNYHDWKPNVLTDHHEMGTNSTFFFQPGVPSRTNPNTPVKNQELTESIAAFHASALDSIGSLYYTKESFDDFYYGKGSTYPDIHGGVGILFEQASSRGHLQESKNGLLSFPFTIRNQVVTSLSTQRACVSLRTELLEYKKSFYTDWAIDNQKEAVQGYVIYDADAVKLSQMIDVMLRHKIEIYPIKKMLSLKNNSYPQAGSYIIPIAQKQGRLVKTLFEKVRHFKDSIFYDVSTWTLPLAFDLQYDELDKFTTELHIAGQKALTNVPEGDKSCVCKDDDYAFVVEWQQAFAPAFLYGLLDDGIMVRTTTQGLHVSSKRGSVHLGAGSLVIPIQGQKYSRTELKEKICALSTQFQVVATGIVGGMAGEGLSVGHPDVPGLEKPSVFTIIGQGVSPYDAGELWHYMDTRLQLPITMIDKKDLTQADLNRYTTMILVEGNYNDLNENTGKKIEDWIRQGGRVIAMSKAIDLIKSKSWAKINLAEADKSKGEDKTRQRPYGQADDILGSRVIGGAIFNSIADLSHPLCFGLGDNQLPLFKQGDAIYKLTENEFATPLRYAANSPVLSGYAPRNFDTRVQGSAAATVHSLGKGSIICFSDNVLFRGYWWGGFRVFANALFFGPVIESSSMER